MPALHPSRRELLGTGLAAAGITVAGCADDPTAGSDAEDSTERVSDLETASLHGPVDAPLGRLPTASDDTAETGDGDDESAPEPDSLHHLIEPADVDALEYDRDREGSDDVRSLLAGTNFDVESVVVYQDRIGECYERCLEYAERDNPELSLQFCQVERDATVACSLEREQLQATFVRLPFADNVEPTRWSIGMTASCQPMPPVDGDGENGTADAEDEE